MVDSDVDVVYRSLVKPQKAALLLIALGQKWAAEVMRHLKEEEVKKISYWIGQMSYIPQELTERIIKEFYSRLTRQSSLSSSGGRAYLFDVLTDIMGKEKASNVLEELTAPKQYEAFQVLKKIDSKQLAAFLKQEQPQTVALMLSFLEPMHAAKIIAALPKELQAEIVIRLARMEEADPEVVAEMEKSLTESLGPLATGKAMSKIGGVKIVANILNSIGRVSEQYILEQITEKDFDLAASIKELMFTFDDMILLDDKSLQLVLKDIAQDDLIVALKGSTEKARDKVFRNLSKRQVETITEELSFLGPVKASVVQVAQQKIVNVIRKLDEEGKILIQGKGGGDDIVT